MRMSLVRQNLRNVVRSNIQYSIDDDDLLPANLADSKQVHTWRIICPQCGAISVLAENERVFEFLERTSPKPGEKPLGRFQMALIALVALAVIAAVISSMVRYFKKQ